MNILIDELPDSVFIDGIEYKINCDFRISILFELLMQDDDFDSISKLENAINLYYPVRPHDVVKAIDSILYFYRCGKDVSSKGSGHGSGKCDNVYSFDFDDDYIYAAFMDQYNIDLQDIVFLHWWKFKAMFKSLKEDNEIVKIMGYRSMDLSKIDKNSREHYKRLKERYKIPKSANEIEKINAIEEALLKGEDVSKIL